MANQRYVLVTLEDAHLIAAALAQTGAHRGGLRDEAGEDNSGKLAAIYDRLVRENGADMHEIIDAFRTMPFCHACRVEGQEESCNVLAAQKLGRRLRRLLERARGERMDPDAVASGDRKAGEA